METKTKIWINEYIEFEYFLIQHGFEGFCLSGDEKNVCICVVFRDDADAFMFKLLEIEDAFCNSPSMDFLAEWKGDSDWEDDLKETLGLY